MSAKASRTVSLSERRGNPEGSGRLSNLLRVLSSFCTNPLLSWHRNVAVGKAKTSNSDNGKSYPLSPRVWHILRRYPPVVSQRIKYAFAVPLLLNPGTAIAVRTSSNTTQPVKTSSKSRSIFSTASQHGKQLFQLNTSSSSEPSTEARR